MGNGDTTTKRPDGLFGPGRRCPHPHGLRWQRNSGRLQPAVEGATGPVCRIGHHEDRSAGDCLDEGVGRAGVVTVAGGGEASQGRPGVPGHDAGVVVGRPAARRRPAEVLLRRAPRQPGRQPGQVHLPERHLFDRRGTARGVRRLRHGQHHHRERWYRCRIPLAEHRYRDNVGDTMY